jgi:hypothetical protein
MDDVLSIVVPMAEESIHMRVMLTIGYLLLHHIKRKTQAPICQPLCVVLLLLP